MTPVRIVTGTALPLNRTDVDTDQIVPSNLLRREQSSGWGDALFANWRSDPTFVMNDPRFGGACILLAGADFGGGSSREHAVWALQDYGFRAVISPKFGDIFRSNSIRRGLLPVQCPAAVGLVLMEAVEADPRLTIVIDVERRQIVAESCGVVADFTLDDIARERFLSGMDEIALTLESATAFDDYEAGRPPWLREATSALGATQVEVRNG